MNIQHHCRHCGNIFCAECSSRNALTPSSKKPVRVCETCFEELQGWFSRSYSSTSPNSFPSLPSSYSSRQKKACLCHISMCTISGQTQCERSHLLVTRGSRVKGTELRDTRVTWRECWWRVLGLSVSVLCLCCSCGLPESGDWEWNAIHLFAVHTHIAIIYLTLFSVAKCPFCDPQVEGCWDTAGGKVKGTIVKTILKICCPAK